MEVIFTLEEACKILREKFGLAQDAIVTIKEAGSDRGTDDNNRMMLLQAFRTKHNFSTISAFKEIRDLSGYGITVVKPLVDTIFSSSVPEEVSLALAKGGISPTVFWNAMEISKKMNTKA